MPNRRTPTRRLHDTTREPLNTLLNLGLGAILLWIVLGL